MAGATTDTADDDGNTGDADADAGAGVGVDGVGSGVAGDTVVMLDDMNDPPPPEPLSDTGSEYRLNDEVDDDDDDNDACCGRFGVVEAERLSTRGDWPLRFSSLSRCRW